MNKELREKLSGIQSELEELLENDDENEGERRLPKRSAFRMSLAAVQKMLDAGLIDVFQVGDEIWSETRNEGTTLCWIVIGKNRDGDDSLTLWCVNIQEDKRFDAPSKEFPYGHALWRDCELRGWLNHELLDCLVPEDAAAITPVKRTTYAPDRDGGELIETEDRLWLLSLSEAGFDGSYVRDEGERYPFFGKDETRQIGDWWRLRSANRGNANSTWIVGTSGYAYYYGYATYALRPAPACVIRKS